MDFVFAHRPGQRDSYALNIADIPNASVITGVEIIPCAWRNSNAKGSATLGVFYRLDGVVSSDFGNYVLEGRKPGDLPATSIPVRIVRTPTTQLETGVAYLSGTKNIQVSRLATRITYETFNGPTALAAANVSTSSLTLSWSDNTVYEDGYVIERSMDGSTFVQIASIGADITTYTDENLAASTMYYYRVQARNAGGGSDYSNIVSATTLPNVMSPSAPSNLIARAISSTTVSISWKDNSDNEDGFVVERAVFGGSFIAIGDAPANVSKYIDTSLGNGTSTFYSYRAHAYNAGGSSANSNVSVIEKIFQNNLYRFYALSGDGNVFAQGSEWTSVHSGTVGVLANYTGDSFSVGAGAAMNTAKIIQRGFISIDTTLYPVGGVITSATLNIFTGGGVSIDTNDQQTYLAIVGPTTQADPNSLSLTDYDKCGTLIDPGVLSNTITEPEWPWHFPTVPAVFTLNSLGVDAIMPGSVTMFGIREGHDIENAEPLLGRTSFWNVSSSENKAAYLEITLE